MKDLTVGKPGRVLLAYSLPLFGSIIFQQLYNIADSFVAGHFISTEALAAVGNSSEITLIFIAIAFGCNIGTSVVTANLFGQKEMKQVHTCVTTALIFCGILGVLLSAVGILTSEWMLTLLDTPVETMKDSVAYIQIYLMSYVFLMLYQVATGIFSALGDSKTPFYFLAVSSITNIFVDILFVRDFHMGVPGVAWATFLCQSISGIVAVIFVLKKVHEVVGGEKCPLFSGVLLKKMLIIAIPSAIQQSFISVGNILVQRVINGFGTACMGGYTAAIKLNNMFVTSVTALGNGMSNYTSQNLGAGKNERVRHGCRSGVAIGMTMGAIFAVVFYVFAKPLVYAFISDGNLEAVDVGVDFLHIVTPFYVFLSIKLMVDGVQRGAARMLQFMIATLSDLFLRVVLSFTLSPIFGIRGVWYSWPVGWIVGIVLSATLYLVWARKLTAGEEKNAGKGRVREVRSSRDAGVKGQCPLRGQGAELPWGVWGNAPTVPRATNSKKVANKGAGSEASLPLTSRVRRRAPAAHSTTCTLSRQMGATDQHRETTPALVFFIAGNFASADATRGFPLAPLALSG